MKETKSIPFILALLLIIQLAYPIRARADGAPNPCIARAGAYANLPNGDQLNVFCPVSGGVQLFRVFDLVLPDGYTYGSALAVAIIQNSKAIPVITEGGFIKVSFVAGNLEPGSSYTILYREQNSPTWIPLKDFLLNEQDRSKSFPLLPGTDDPRKIISGVKLLMRDGVQRVEVSVNFPGIFVLAQY
jgi:hypothetical protein